jgi:hypothetical protein
MEEAPRVKWIRKDRVISNKIHLSVSDSSTYLMKGEMKNSITLLSPVLISAVTAIPGAMGTSLSLTRMLKRLGL